MDLELEINGTPAQFGVMAELFYRKTSSKYEQGQGPVLVVEIPTINHGKPIPADINPLWVWFIWEGRIFSRDRRCYIVAHSLPDNNKSLLRITAKDEYWPGLSIFWYGLLDEMKRQGFIDNKQSEPEIEVTISETKKLEPWKLIPNHLWDREAVEMWCGGQHNEQIGNAVGVSKLSVTNRISELRKLYPQAKIPKDDER